jgi:hypothetical protein
MLARIKLAVKKELRKKGINTHFGFTAPGTPQENGKVMRALKTLWGRTQTILNKEMLTEE